MPSGTPKIIFANQLRGLAALSVAGSHLVGVFWAMRDFVGLATATPVQGDAAPALLSVFNQPWLNFGPLGVGVFFLISGLVIPISLEQHSRVSFLFARLLRIYPTYIVALLIEMAVLRANAAYWNMSFPYGNWTIISNALLIYNTVGQPSVDLVNWTLCVELKFYLLMMLVAPQIRRGSVPTLLLIAAAIFATDAVLTWYPFPVTGRLHALASQFTMESIFVVFMLIGVLFNFRLRGLLRLPGLVGSCAILVALFLASWAHSAIAEQIPFVTINYIYGFILFSVLFYFRKYARPVWAFDFLAAISYPFYLVHSLLGFSILKVLILRMHVAYILSVCIAFGAVVIVATVLHFIVEVPSIGIGRSLVRQRPGRPSSPQTPQRITAA